MWACLHASAPVARAWAYPGHVHSQPRQHSEGAFLGSEAGAGLAGTQIPSTPVPLRICPSAKSGTQAQGQEPAAAQFSFVGASKPARPLCPALGGTAEKASIREPLVCEESPRPTSDKRREPPYLVSRHRGETERRIRAAGARVIQAQPWFPQESPRLHPRAACAVFDLTIFSKALSVF